MIPAVIHHPQRLAQLRHFFPATCTIQERTDTQDAAGQPIPTWSNLAGHVDIPVRVSPAAAQEIKRPNGTIAVVTHLLSLRGHYPAVTPRQRAIVADVAYDILAAESDSQGGYTRLRVEIVT